MRLLSFAVWALVAASAVFWLTRLLARADAGTRACRDGEANTRRLPSADLSRLLGSTRVAAAVRPRRRSEPAVDARFKLIGVVAPRSVGRPDRAGADRGRQQAAAAGEPGWRGRWLAGAVGGQPSPRRVGPGRRCRHGAPGVARGTGAQPLDAADGAGLPWPCHRHRRCLRCRCRGRRLGTSAAFRQRRADRGLPAVSCTVPSVVSRLRIRRPAW